MSTVYIGFVGLPRPNDWCESVIPAGKGRYEAQNLNGEDILWNTRNILSTLACESFSDKYLALICDGYNSVVGNVVTPRKRKGT